MTAYWCAGDEVESGAEVVSASYGADASSDLEAIVRSDSISIDAPIESQTVDGPVEDAAMDVLEGLKSDGYLVEVSGYVDMYGKVWCSLSTRDGEACVVVVRESEDGDRSDVQKMFITQELLS